MNPIKQLLTATALVAATFAIAAPVQAIEGGASDCDRCAVNGVRLNGFTLNGFRLNGLNLNGLNLNGLRVNGPVLQGVAANGLNFNGPGIVIQGPAAHGLVDGQDNAPIAVRLASGKIVRLR